MATTAHTYITDSESIGDDLHQVEESDLHFKIALDECEDLPISCSLRLVQAANTTAGLYVISKKPSLAFSVDTGLENLDESQTLEYIRGNLDNCSIYMVDGRNSKVAPEMQNVVRKLTHAWASSLKSRPFHRHTSSSTSTLASALPPQLLAPRLPWMSAGGSNLSLSSELSASSSSDSSVGTLTDDEEEGDIGMAFHGDSSGPPTPTTAATTPAQSPGKLSPEESYFEGQMLARLAAVEWENMHAYELRIEETPRAAPSPPTREIELPTTLEPVVPPNSRTSVEEPSVEPAPEAIAAVADASTVQPAQARPLDADEAPSTRWWQLGQLFEKAEMFTSTSKLPQVILPSPPTDDEKYLYAETRRLPLYLFGTLSFLAVSVGMWFFTISAASFYWFGLFCGLIQIYLIISYVVGYCGRDFSVDAHKQAIQDYPLTFEPSVDIYLPCCKEPLEVLENTYKYVSLLDYTNFKVHVLDDGAQESVRLLASKYGFNYMCRDNRPHLKKAGNLRWAFARTEGAFFVIFDADFCPRADFLKETIPYMEKEPDVAIIQSPQFFRPCAEQTWVEQGASSTQELFYRIVQVNRDRWGAAICVGSNALYRRDALAEVGGTAEIGHSEDVHTGFYALTRGWRVKYMPLALACGVSPDTPKAFFSQQMRWCSGSTTLLTNPDFWKSDLSAIQKMCYLSGFMYYSAAGLMVFLTPLPGLLLLAARPEIVLWFNCLYALPSLIYSVFVFRLWSRQRYNFNVNFVFTIQQAAYAMAIKDKLMGTTASWVPSGDNSSHGEGEKVANEDGIVKKPTPPNNKYMQMRIVFYIWIMGTTTAIFTLSAVRIAQGFAWYNFVPLLILDSFNLFITRKFIFCTS